ncbi:MAG: hypothetical protein PHW04_01180 [Candidatus Wallbacteria bacterium]|nr:hypothetical protein [Candidatus Wallbacteria bacterium]
MAFKTVEFVRKTRDNHHEFLKGKSFDEIKKFYSGKARAVTRIIEGKEQISKKKKSKESHISGIY